jgi:hypothetical protein
MPARRKPRSTTSANGDEPKVENGFYMIHDVEGGEGEYDWGPKNPQQDPPIGQYRFSESAREIYSWCVDYVDDENEYVSYRDHLKTIVIDGIVSEPINPEAYKRLEELRTDLLEFAKRKLHPSVRDATACRLTIAFLVYLLGLLSVWISTSRLGVFGNWVLFVGSALGASAVLIWYGELKELRDYREWRAKLDSHFHDVTISLILVLGVAYILQNKWITLSMGTKTIEISESAMGALAVGFVLGLLSDKLMQLLRPFLERVSRAIGNAPQQERRVTARRR